MKVRGMVGGRWVKHSTKPHTRHGQAQTQKHSIREDKKEGKKSTTTTQNSRASKWQTGRQKKREKWTIHPLLAMQVFAVGSLQSLRQCCQVSKKLWEGASFYFGPAFFFAWMSDN